MSRSWHERSSRSRGRTPQASPRHGQADDDVERRIQRSEVVGDEADQTRPHGDEHDADRPATKQTSDPARDPHDDDPALPEEGAD